jgi:acyl-CoA synthetase (AMP-forming)/AMP-acid ligase II
MQIRDRVKDVVKSGGEWISSIELENVAVGHPDVAEAAVIGVAHPKWDGAYGRRVVVLPGFFALVCVYVCVCGLSVHLCLVLVEC